MRVIDFLLVGSVAVLGAPPADATELSPLGLELHGVEVDQTHYGGAEALRVRQLSGAGVALVRGAGLVDGTIEVEVAGSVDPEASFVTRFLARGFIGIAFRVEPGLVAYERIYLRPTNARSEDQLRRNHSTQYDSLPEHPWSRLREESPGKYESYVDLEPGVWTHMRIVLSGDSARLYIGEAEQPALVVQDLKRAATSSGVGLFVGPGTLGYFRNLQIRTEAEPDPGSDR